MIGNLYCLDIKLQKIDEKLYPTGIEMNGVDSGTDFFRYEQGLGYYRKFARVLAAHTNGKPIFMEAWERDQRDPLEIRIAKSELRERHRRNKLLCTKIAEIVGGEFGFDYGWLDDLLEFDLSNLDKPEESEDPFYAHAARLEGVDMVFFKDVRFGPNYLEFTLKDGRNLRVKPRDIGAIKSNSSTLYSVPERYANLFLNNPFMETVMASKPLFHFVNEFIATFSGDNLAALMFPFTFPHGYGVNNNEKLLEFLDLVSSDLVVRKRGGSYCGTGVEVLDRQELIAEIKRRSSVRMDPLRVQALTLLVMQSILAGHHMEEYVSVYQPFIDSIPVFNPQTKAYHDGCARSIVYVPPNGKPIAIGSQWRLAPASMDQEEDLLEDRFRANLSRGATPLIIPPEHEAVIDNFAILLAEYFDVGIQAVQNELHSLQESMEVADPFKFRMTKTMSDSQLLRTLFWSYHSANKMTDYGLMEDMSESSITRLQEINDLPGLREKFREILGEFRDADEEERKPRIISDGIR